MPCIYKSEPEMDSIEHVCGFDSFNRDEKMKSVSS